MIKNTLKNKGKSLKLTTLGFTLIELLAVIVILAIIALIATPIILNIIKDSKIESIKRSAENYLDAVEQALVRRNITEEFKPATCTIISTGLNCNGYSEPLKIDIDGKISTTGTIKFDNSMVSKGTTFILDNYIISVNDDNKITIKPYTEPKSFATDSWQTIVDNIRLGNLEKYNVGDSKSISGSKFAFTKARIVNTSTPNVCNDKNFSQTACGFVLEFEYILKNDVIMTRTGTNENGWKDSFIKKYLISEILYDLSDELEEFIIDTLVVSGYSKEYNNENFYTTDKLYLLSPKEIYGITPEGDTLTQTRQLDYYNKEKVSIENFSKASKKYNGNNSEYWLRSPLQNLNGFFTVASDGSLVDFDADFELGLSLAFRIG